MSIFAKDQEAQFVLSRKMGVIVLGRDLNQSHVGKGLYCTSYRDYYWSPISAIRTLPDGSVELEYVDVVSSTPYTPSQPPTVQVDLHLDPTFADPSQGKLVVKCDLKLHNSRRKMACRPDSEYIISTDAQNIPSPRLSGSVTAYVDQPCQPPPATTDSPKA